MLSIASATHLTVSWSCGQTPGNRAVVTCPSRRPSNFETTNQRKAAMKKTNLDHPLKRHFPTRSAAEELLVRAHTPAQSQHSPLPWRIWQGGVIDANNAIVNGEANVIFAVLACNNVQRLTDALKEIGQNVIRRGDAIWMRDTARQALTDCGEQV